jgi:hypothetical protein
MKQFSPAPRIKQFSEPPRSADQMLLERIQQLHDHRCDQPIQSHEYKRLSSEIRELSALWQAHRGEAVRTARPKH